MAVTVIIVIFVCWYRRKKACNASPDVHESSSRSRGKKRGYGLQDEKEDDSDDENDLRIEYAKPTL